MKTSCCGALYELDPQVGKILLHGGQVDITQSDLTLVQEGNGQYDNGFGNVLKKCPDCGYETKEDFEFCPKCGKRF